MQAFSRRLSTWLLRPYLDLGPLIEGPLHAQRVEECWRAFAAPDEPYFIAQRTLLPGFRTGLLEEAGDARYAVTDPRRLPEALRTERWRELCEALDAWTELAPKRRVRLLALLHALCLYECVTACLGHGDLACDDACDAELAFWDAFARYMLAMPAGDPQHHDADMARFQGIALRDGDHAPARFNAAIRVFVHKAKTGDRDGDLGRWGARLERSLVDAVAHCSDFAAGLLRSRFYRAIAFIPQGQGNRGETVRTMDLAERHALAMQPCNAAEEILYRENLHALLESRTKEALWIGEKDLALSRSLRVVEVDRYDSKAWAEVGQVRMLREEWREAAEAYALAALLGPPASAIARHMAGVCLQKEGRGMLAGLMFKDAAEIDPAGISPGEALSALPNDALRTLFSGWLSHTAQL